MDSGGRCHGRGTKVIAGALWVLKFCRRFYCFFLFCSFAYAVCMNQGYDVIPSPCICVFPIILLVNELLPLFLVGLHSVSLLVSTGSDDNIPCTGLHHHAAWGSPTPSSNENVLHAGK